MKLFITTLILAGNIFFISCKKTRSCDCKFQTTTTTTTTPRSSGSSTTTVGSSSGETNDSYAKVKKDDLKRLYDCNDRNQITQSTYTSQTTVATQTTIGGNTFTTYVSVNTDVTQKNNTDYTCELK